jgi:2-polyprenyl-3-methyl-5-hydroxy-6-metoxy-1,4-benzoquinol methylase
MLARDWYYNERRQIGLDSAVASICDRHDDSDLRARAALSMLGVQRGWRVADIGCGNGVLACEAALMGAEVDAIDISPAMLALAEIQARDRKVAIRTQSAGLLSFAYRPETYDLIVSEFALHHLPDFWKAVALSRIFSALKPGSSFYLRDIVFVGMPDGPERDVEQWASSTSRTTGFRATASSPICATNIRPSAG